MEIYGKFYVCLVTEDVDIVQRCYETNNVIEEYSVPGVYRAKCQKTSISFSTTLKFDNKDARVSR